MAEGLTPFTVQDGRLRALRGETSGEFFSEQKTYLVAGFCLHGEALTVTCGACADDINYLEASS